MTEPTVEQLLEQLTQSPQPLFTREMLHQIPITEASTPLLRNAWRHLFTNIQMSPPSPPLVTDKLKTFFSFSTDQGRFLLWLAQVNEIHRGLIEEYQDWSSFSASNLTRLTRLLPNLRTLGLLNTHLTPELACILVRQLPHLQSLHVKMSDKSTDDALTIILSGIRNLQELSLKLDTNCPLTPNLWLFLSSGTPSVPGATSAAPNLARLRIEYYEHVTYDYADPDRKLMDSPRFISDENSITYRTSLAASRPALVIDLQKIVLETWIDSDSGTSS